MFASLVSSVCAQGGVPRGPHGNAWCVDGLGDQLVGGDAEGGAEAEDVFCDCLAALVDGSTAAAAPLHWVLWHLVSFVPTALLLVVAWLACATSGAADMPSIQKERGVELV